MFRRRIPPLRGPSLMNEIYPVKRQSSSFRPPGGIISAPPLVYIQGEEMTRYAGTLYLDQLVKPYVDITKWEFFDLSCKHRDATNDQVLKDCISAGARIGAIYKEPTITPTTDQVKEFGLKKALGSPNGAMRRGWNGISISRDTIHLEGMRLGYKTPCLFDRHAIGGEYGANFATVGKGKVKTVFTCATTGKERVVDERKLNDETSAIVIYDNPYDNVSAMGHHFFKRCLVANVTPYVVTKKTVFKWQETFWEKLKFVFDTHYKQSFLERGLTSKSKGELVHFLSDVASMQLIRWTDGGWGMCSHNYDGDVLTDEMAQVHRSPGFLTSVLNGIGAEGLLIKEYEASHGTVTDMWKDHLNGKETSLNPLSMMEALIGAMEHSAKGERYLTAFSANLRKAIHAQMCTPGKGTRDLSGPQGLTTEQFVSAVRGRLDKLQAMTIGEMMVADGVEKVVTPDNAHLMDMAKVRELFNRIDVNGDGTISFDEFSAAVKWLGVAPTPEKKKAM